MASRREPNGWKLSGGRWALSLSLPILGGLSWFLFGWSVAWGNALIATLASIAPAVTCLVAGWLLRSWWGLVATVAVYMAVSALIWGLFVVGPGDLQAWALTFPLHVALPGLVMAAIGTIAGRYSAGRRGQRPSFG